MRLSLAAGFLLAGCKDTGSRCLSLADEGNLAAAHACYDDVLKSNPGDAQVWHNAGLLLAIDGRYAAAQRYFLKTVNLKPGYAEAWYNLGLNYHHLKDPKNAIECFDRAIRLKPDYLPAWKQKCLLLEMSGGLFGITPADSLWKIKRGLSRGTNELLELVECREKLGQLIQP
jgi:tetratricopeptide (TPR) repeat protein